MEGVLILHEFRPIIDRNIGIGMIVVSFVAMIIGIILLLIYRDNYAAFYRIGAVALIAGCLLAVLGLVICNEQSNSKTYYKVYCDETVNMVEFNEKYQIIEQEGKIYTVEERNLTKKGE